MPPRTAPNRGGQRGARGESPSAPRGRGGGAGRGSRSETQDMPPRTAPNRGGPRDARGGQSPSAPRGRGGGAGRGGRSRNAPQPPAPQQQQQQLVVRSDIKTICVRRPNFGTAANRTIQLEVNSFELTAKDNDISHYDVTISPDTLSYKRKFVLFQHLQNEYPTIFTPKLVYDGQKMAYSTQPLTFGPENARQFDISFPRTGGSDLSRPPKVFNIKLTKVATIGTDILRRFIAGQQTWDESVENALMAYNIAIRTDPNLNNPYRGRSFYNEKDRWNIGGGFEVWRGIFQSVRPVIGRLVVNIDLTATIMYRDGPLIHVINDFYRKPTSSPPTYLVPGNPQFPSPYDKVRLQRFLNALRVTVMTTGDRSRGITGLTANGADSEYFQLRDGGTISVADYFNQLGYTLQYPKVICVKIGSDAKVPLEMCTVLKGQFANNKVDTAPDQVAQILRFATKKPVERLESIKAGIEHLQFNQSNYIAQFGLSIKKEPLKITARIIDPPTMRYSGGGSQAALVPKFGAWNMIDKHFIRPGSIKVWAIAVYGFKFGGEPLQNVIKDFQIACKSVGILIDNAQPIVKTFNPQGNVAKQLQSLGADCVNKYKTPPSLIVVILPDGAGDLYTLVKRFGNVTFGVATQCLQAKKCTRANMAYWANVMLKVNVKLGGINATLESGVMEYISDPANPTIFIGADAMHPASGAAGGRPSITAVVGSVDSSAAKYTGTTCVQRGRHELIVDLKDMCKLVLENYKGYRREVEEKIGDTLNPRRLIFYRDGVSEGEFQQVLDQELPLIQGACEELGMNPKITLIVVRKRHHNQMFPVNNAKDNRNAPAGTVIDTVITHPTEFDFFLQSHAGILGTSRPAHYSVLHDENGFNADSLQALSYALCHAYAPATRSVSLPAPVYYADKMCYNSKINFVDAVSSDTGSQASDQAAKTLEAYKKAFKPAHPNQQTRMYFV